jgi:acyl-CoA thioester hydrolase
VSIPIRVPLELRWADTDQYGHVNNVTAVRLAEEARIRALGLPEKPEHFPPGAPPALAVLGTDTFTMTVSQQFEYTAELPYSGQTVVAEVWLSKATGRSITMECRVLSADGILYFIARVAVVIMDVATRRPRPLTDDEVARLGAYVADPLTFRD